jgi:hypothetical protein
MARLKGCFLNGVGACIEMVPFGGSGLYIFITLFKSPAGRGACNAGRAQQEQAPRPAIVTGRVVFAMSTIKIHSVIVHSAFYMT